VTGAPGMPLSVAVRPEKIHIAKERPEGVAQNLFKGKVREIAYLGSYSTYVVAMASGKLIKVTGTNTSRTEAGGITWDDEVFFWWDGAAPVVLTQ
jgi:putrescine transport system ATP-binding protein